MAGIYLHIPFCHSRCSYCDFYTVTNTTHVQKFVDALCTEISTQNKYLDGERIHTIYFGGGTPSVLSQKQLQQIFDVLYTNFLVDANAEVSLEANPDDLTSEYLQVLADSSINRLSMGVQSFDNEDLVFMNRRHSAQQAKEAIVNANKAGFTNLTIDLIYGLPKQTPKKWIENLNIALDLPVQHLSCYHLMYEEGTPITRLKNQKKITPVIESISNKMFNILIDQTTNAGFEHYEISNFALPGYYSRHNSSYWKGEKYLGVGPSAHSYNGQSRQWNKKGVFAYIKSINEGVSFFEKETLSALEQFNEYIITRLRTHWGCNETEMKALFDTQLVHTFVKNLQRWIVAGNIIKVADAWRLSRSGIMISDAILLDVILVD